jgi:hypothetical protein
MWRSPGLELNDLGFLRQADRMLQWTWMGYSWNNPFAIFRSLRFNFNQWAGWNFGRERVFQGGNINGGGQFKNHWWFWMGGGPEGSNLSTSALRGGPALKTPGNWNFCTVSPQITGNVFNLEQADRTTGAMMIVPEEIVFAAGYDFALKMPCRFSSVRFIPLEQLTCSTLTPYQI